VQGARTAVALVAFALPFAAWAVATRLAVPVMAERIQGPLSMVASWVVPTAGAAAAETAAPAPTPEPAAQPAPSAERLPSLRASSRVERGPVVRSRGRAVPPTSHGEAAPESVFVSVDRLLQLTPGQLRAVRFAGVRDEQGDPRGVRLWGVGALGVGLADGDVVVAIDGRPTRTEDEATAAGASAWSSGEGVVRASLMRGDRPIAVAVQLPAGRR